MKHALPLLAALLLGACATLPYPPSGPTSGFGEVAMVDGVQVRPLNLLEDSRCPQSVQCVWAGQVRIGALVNNQPRELTSGKPIAVAGGQLTLVDVQPPRRAPDAIPPGAYRFTFSFQR